MLFQFRRIISALFFLGLFLSSSQAARADISFYLHEAIGFAAEWNSAGHAAIYLSHVCTDGDNKLRLCAPHEQGVVISASNHLGAKENYEWVAIPHTPFLYAVENERDIPLYANEKIRALLRENYRRKHLSKIIPTPTDNSIPSGYWQMMIGSALNRDIYCFTVKTTPEQDLALIEKLNGAPNSSSFQLFFNNCTDFAAKILNTYFPGAARKDWLNDFGTTTPKAIAKSFTRFAAARPELQWQVTKFSQVAGTIKRSQDNRHVTQQLLLSKKYLPLIFIKPPVAAALAGIYLTTGRFNAEQQYQKFRAREISQTGSDVNTPIILSANSLTGNFFVPPFVAQKERHLLSNFAPKNDWSKYQNQFTPVLHRAIADGYFADENEVKTFFRDLDQQSSPAFDESGGLLLRVNDYGHEQMLGLTRANLLSPNSNQSLAFKLMLSKIYFVLHSQEKNRSPFSEFLPDMDLLLRLNKICAQPTEYADVTPKLRPRFLPNPAPISVKKKTLQFLLRITH